MYIYVILIVALFVIIWSIGSYVVIWNIEKPAYTVITKKAGYEIRVYEPYLKAETTVTGDYTSATNQGFRIIADYIFGNNTSQNSIAMTSPVLEARTSETEKIAMTTPVLESVASTSERTIAFILPSKYTLETLPQPNNPAITITEVPGRTIAALTFTWYPTGRRVEAKKTLLEAYLKRDGYVIAGPIETARYNPPLSMPLMLRNEILIPVLADQSETPQAASTSATTE